MHRNARPDENAMAAAPAAALPETRALRPLARCAVGRSGADIERALGAGRQDTSRKVRWRMAVHEAGHALVQLAAGNSGIQLISIEAAYGGFVRMEEERHPLQTENWTMAEITVRPVGRATEELVFGDPPAGSGEPLESDLGVATDMATLLATAVGFGRHQPLLHRETFRSCLSFSVFDRHTVPSKN